MMGPPNTNPYWLRVRDLEDDDAAVLKRLGLEPDFDPRPLKSRTLISVLEGVAYRQRAALAA
jgi:hypothetical protein